MNRHKQIKSTRHTILFIATAFVAGCGMIIDTLPRNTTNQLATLSKDRSPMHFFVNYCPEDSGGYSVGLGQKYQLAYVMDGMCSIIIPGDIVWLVSVRAGKVELATKFTVSEVLDYNTARERSKKRLFRSDEYLWAKETDVQKLQSIPFSKHVLSLRFIDGLSPDQIVANENGHFMVKYFWQIRILSPESIRLLEDVYTAGKKETR